MHWATLLLPLAAVAQVASAASWYKPAAGTTFLYAINGGSVQPNATSSYGIKLNPQLIDVDLFDTSTTTIAGYKKQGKKVACYFSAGSFEPWRSDIKSFATPACYCNQGASCKMDGWDEWWLNIHSTTCKASVKKVMTARIDLAKSKGCDAVDFDNVDSYTNDQASGPFGTTEADQLAYNIWLATAAHNRGLGAALKNAGDLVAAYPTKMVAAFDFSVVEQCEEYEECAVYQPFISAGKPAFDIEYGKKAAVLKKGWFSMVYAYNDLQAKYVYRTAPAY